MMNILNKKYLFLSGFFLIFFSGLAFAQESHFTGILVKKHVDDPEIEASLGRKNITYTALELPKSELISATNDENELIKIKAKTIQLSVLDKKTKLPFNKKVTITCSSVDTPTSIYHFGDVVCTLKSIKEVE